MTKKHFIELADVMRDQVKRLLLKDDYKVVEDAMVYFCKRQNPRFQEGIWRGYIEGTCGPNGGAR